MIKIQTLSVCLYMCVYVCIRDCDFLIPFVSMSLVFWNQVKSLPLTRKSKSSRWSFTVEEGCLDSKVQLTPSISVVR